ncbi:hypothetical protein I4F81_012475 [Pyropia yezoensis]|uniref:Uncharacterized protein n=1 Tax=Pyropia yezoensis TaxID=2788 RepID=A0ACC3CJ83_PYRYE|nr:hypothetical protein I4F81_012475 [Neopyropia yezoensis]
MPPPPPGPLRVAIIGAGPAGLYTASSLLTHFRSRLPSPGAAAAAAAAAAARTVADPAASPRAAASARGRGDVASPPSAATNTHAAPPPPPAAPLAIDIYEAAAVPFGLIRSGVAPDHGSVKRVATTLDETVLRNPAVRLFANTPVSAEGGEEEEGEARGPVGSSVPLPALRSAYHAVVVAAGGGGGVVPPLPGAHLRGVLPALEYVGWLNGHSPATATAAGGAAAAKTLPPGGLSPDTPVASAVVLGAGNVALDVARSLVTAPSGLAAATDAAAGAVGVLAAWEAAAAASSTRRRVVTLVARRGPAQAAWTPKELRELLGGTSPVEGGGRWAVSVEPEEVALDAVDAASVAKTRPARRCIEALQAAAAAASSAPRGVDGGDGGDGVGGGAPSGAALREARLRFCLRPEAFLPSPTDGTRVGAVRFARVALGGPAGGRTGTPTGETVTLPADMVVTATGYAGCPLAGDAGGLPRDSATGGVAHMGGRVVAADSDRSADGAAPVAGLYVAGWAKRGPSGIIATNKWDAEETAAAVAADWAAGRLHRPAADNGDPTVEGAMATAISSRQVVDAAGWARVDAAERAAGAAAGKAEGVREKVVALPALLALARGEAARTAAVAAAERRRGG